MEELKNKRRTKGEIAKQINEKKNREDRTRINLKGTKE